LAVGLLHLCSLIRLLEVQGPTGAFQVSVDEAAVLSPEPNASMVALDDALEALAKIAPPQAQVVELRYFRGIKRGAGGRGNGDIGKDCDAGLGVREGLVIAGVGPIDSELLPVRQGLCLTRTA
jgi:hypothetical protein